MPAIKKYGDPSPTTHSFIHYALRRTIPVLETVIAWLPTTGLAPAFSSVFQSPTRFFRFPPSSRYTRLEPGGGMQSWACRGSYRRLLRAVQPQCRPAAWRTFATTPALQRSTRAQKQSKKKQRLENAKNVCSKTSLYPSNSYTNTSCFMNSHLEDWPSVASHNP